MIIPQEFQIRNRPYPADNTQCFEEWYHERYEKNGEYHQRTLLPIYWTGYYVRHGIDKTTYGYSPAWCHLQEFLNSLSGKVRYYTIVQHDDGILNDIRHLDIQVFSLGSPRNASTILPLACAQHPYHFNNKRTFFASFTGRVTHPIRNELLKLYTAKKGYYISMMNRDMRGFCDILSRSVFALCPRGYGVTSFRIAEAMQYGAIPVYISDGFLRPYEDIFFEDMGIVTINEKDVPYLHEILTRIDIDEYTQKVQHNKHLFTFEHMEQFIHQEVNKINLVV